MIEADAGRLPLPDGSFDRVSSNGVLVTRPTCPPLSARSTASSVPALATIVLIFSRRELVPMMRAAGFGDVTTEIRHFGFGSRFPRLALFQQLGRVFGWYVIGRGTAASSTRA